MKLRRVQIEIDFINIRAKELGFKKGDVFAGDFHGFYQEGNSDDGLDVCALVELDNGILYKYYGDKLTFIK